MVLLQVQCGIRASFVFIHAGTQIKELQSGLSTPSHIWPQLEKLTTLTGASLIIGTTRHTNGGYRNGDERNGDSAGHA